MIFNDCKSFCEHFNILCKYLIPIEQYHTYIFTYYYNLWLIRSWYLSKQVSTCNGGLFVHVLQWYIVSCLCPFYGHYILDIVFVLSHVERNIVLENVRLVLWGTLAVFWHLLQLTHHKDLLLSVVCSQCVWEVCLLTDILFMMYEFTMATSNNKKHELPPPLDTTSSKGKVDSMLVCFVHSTHALIILVDNKWFCFHFSMSSSYSCQSYCMYS